MTTVPAGTRAAPPTGGAAAPARPLHLRVVETIGLTQSGAVVLALAAVGWLVARLLGGRTLFLLVYGAVIVLVVARVLGRARGRLAAHRSELPQRLRQGQGAEVELSVTVPRRAGVFLLEERMHPLLGRPRTIPVAGSGSREVTYRYSVTPRLRGVYSVGPLVAVSTDPFGLTRRVTELVAAETVVVHPATEAVTDRPLTRQWEDPPVRPPNSRPWPSGFEFYGMRDYVVGDDLRRVVWRAVARTGRMLTRESEQGITDQVVVLLDTDAAGHSPGEPSDTFEAAVKTAASLATRHLRDGFSVTLLGNDGPLCPPLRGATGRIPALDALARVGTGRTPLAAGVDGVLTSARRDVHLLVVTPKLDEGVAARLRLLNDRGTRLVVVVIAHEDTDPATLRLAGGIGAQSVVLRPLASLDAAFRVASEAASLAGRAAG